MITYSDDDLLALIDSEFCLEENIEDNFTWFIDEHDCLIDQPNMELCNFVSNIFSGNTEFKDIAEDIKIELLDQALIELQKFFYSKRNQKKYSEIFNELFYTEHQIYDVVSKEGIKLGYWNKDNIPSKIFEIQNLNVQIPKMKLCWSLFILATNSEKTGKDLNKLVQKDLRLKWTKNKQLVEVGKFTAIQEKFILFMRALCLKMVETTSAAEIALNLFCFNKVSLLLDLTLIAKNEGFNFEGNLNLINIGKLKGMSTKHKVIATNYKIDELINEENINASNHIFNECEKLLESLFISLDKIEDHGLPESVSKAYITYKYLSNNVYYDTKALEQFVTMDKINFNITNMELDRFGLIYKAFYKTLD